jgi:hypothetical protein
MNGLATQPLEGEGGGLSEDDLIANRVIFVFYFQRVSIFSAAVPLIDETVL